MQRVAVLSTSKTEPEFDELSVSFNMLIESREAACFTVSAGTVVAGNRGYADAVEQIVAIAFYESAIR